MKGETNGNHKRKGRPLRPGDPCEKIQQPASIRIPHRKYNTPAPPCQEESPESCHAGRCRPSAGRHLCGNLHHPAGSKQETNILPPTTTVGTYIPDTSAPAAETVEPTEPAVRYPLTDAERDVVERVVMAEAGGESFEGQMLVAQCILNAAEKRGVDPSEAVVLYSYTKSRPDPTQRVKDAVAAVFDRGETVVDEPILYFYNPALVTSDFHESQIFVIEEGGHRFFAERSTR